MLHQRPGQSRVRDRDTGRRHQHARTNGRDREAHQVHRRESPAVDAGGVHPADRACRSTWHRRQGQRGGPLVTRGFASTRWPNSPPAPRSISGRHSGRRTTWRRTSIRTYTSEQAHHLLNLSFAQYQADRDVVRLEARLERLRDKLVELRHDSVSEFGDIDDYRRARAEAADRRSAGQVEQNAAINDAVRALRPGRSSTSGRDRSAGMRSCWPPPTARAACD